MFRLKYSINLVIPSSLLSFRKYFNELIKPVASLVSKANIDSFDPVNFEIIKLRIETFL
jgi:hypothetical protein